MTTPTDTDLALPDFAALAKTLGTPDATFDAWRDATADKHWKHFDLSALRIGYELGKAAYGPCAQPESATLYQQLMNTLGAKDQIDAMRILAGHHARELQAQPASVPIGGVRGQPIVTTEMCEAAFVALRKEVIDGRNPMHPDEAALIHDAIAAAINAAPENSSSQIPQATGSFNCPICGEAYSHQHSGEEIVEFRRRSERHDERALAFRQAALLLRREAQALEDSGSSIHTKNTYLRYAAYLKDNDFRNRDCIPLIVASQMRAALDECIEWLGPYKAQLATDFKGYEQHSDAGRVLDAIMHAQSAVNAYLAAAPQPAKDRPVCNRDCDCVGECKAGVE